MKDGTTAVNEERTGQQANEESNCKVTNDTYNGKPSTLPSSDPTSGMLFHQLPNPMNTTLPGTTFRQFVRAWGQQNGGGGHHLTDDEPALSMVAPPIATATPAFVDTTASSSMIPPPVPLDPFQRNPATTSAFTDYTPSFVLPDETLTHDLDTKVEARSCSQHASAQSSLALLEHTSIEVVEPSTIEPQRWRGFLSRRQHEPPTITIVDGATPNHETKSTCVGDPNHHPRSCDDIHTLSTAVAKLHTVSETDREVMELTNQRDCMKRSHHAKPSAYESSTANSPASSKRRRSIPSPREGATMAALDRFFVDRDASTVTTASSKTTSSSTERFVSLSEERDDDDSTMEFAASDDLAYEMSYRPVAREEDLLLHNSTIKVKRRTPTAMNMEE